MADIRQSGAYARVVKAPKKRGIEQFSDWWQRCWYFERLLVVLLVLCLPLAANYMWGYLTAQLTLKLEADKLSAKLRDLKAKARENAAFVYVVARPSEPGKCIWEVKSSKSQPKSVLATFPKGFSVYGRVVFDPLGVPDAPTNFTIRQGFETIRIHIDSQGFVSRQ